MTAFIPVKSEKDLQLHKPSEVYFAKRENTNELYGSAFTFVDFGERANTFLQYCGVKSEPSVKGKFIRMSRADDRYRLVTHPRTREDIETSWFEGEVGRLV